MWYQTGQYPHELPDSALNYLVSPRNVAWVSTVDEHGRANLAPFSYFMALSAPKHKEPCPELVMISCVKDCAVHTLGNIKLNGQLVINGVDGRLKDPMFDSGEDIEPSETEFSDLGVTATDSKLVKPPRVSESQWSLECELVETREYDGGATMIVAKVLGTHIQDGLCSSTGIAVNNYLHGPAHSDESDTLEMPNIKLSNQSTKTNVKLLKALGERQHKLPEHAASADWIRKRSGLPWLELDITVPTADIMREWQAIQTHTATQWERGDDWQGISNHAWKSLTLHGLSAERHERQPRGASINGWTEVADQCPMTKQFLESHFNISSSDGAIRFLLLQPGGYIVPHRDQREPGLQFCNIGIDVPDGTHFYMEKYGNMPYKSGSCLIWDHSVRHWVVNDSDRPRLHLSVVAHVKDNVLIRSYNKLREN